MQLKEQSNIGKAAVCLIDVLVIYAAYRIAYVVFAQHHIARYDAQPPPPARYIWLVFIFIPLVCALLYHYNLLEIVRSRHSKQVIIRVTKTFLLVGIALSGMIFITKAKYYSRLLFGTHVLLAYFLMLIEKTIFNYLGRKGILYLGAVRHALVVGEGPKAERIRGIIEKDPGLKLDKSAAFPASVSFDTFKNYLLQNPIDEIYFVLPRSKTLKFTIDPFLKFCERIGVPAKVVVNMSDQLKYFETSLTSVEDMPAVVVHPPHLDPDRAMIKRLMDIAGSLMGLTITALVMPVIAIMIKLDSEGPVFYHQRRVGQNGRLFRIHKFRSMVIGADEMKAELEAHNEMDGPIFKMQDDPRITRVGAFLRRFNIDEFPQFWNVLKGEMSLVGTRPPTPEEVDEYELWHYRRISIRPGITGMWQVSGRQEIRNFRKIVQLDLKYIDEWSLGLDLKILGRTFFHFPRGE